MLAQHALLSASSASRWMHCPPSARLEETLPDSTSDYAAEGTLAHAIGELKVRKKFLEPMSTRSYNSRMKKLEADPLYDPEMQQHTDAYLDYITGVTMAYPSRPYVTAEKRLDYSNYAPEGFGTGDCIIIGGDTLHVIDFKYGKGVPVSSEENPQMMLYALGAIDFYNIIYDIKQIVLTIVQPRLDSISEWTIERDKLLDWGVFTVRPVAQTAFNGEGDYCPGDWCRFCRAKAQCRARADTNTALEDFKGIAAPSKAESGKFPLPPLLSNTEVGEVLQKAIDLEKWASDLKEYALSAILAGEDVQGWKAVEGVSRRSWDDQETAFSDIKAAGIDEAMLYERKPVTAPALEKALGKKLFTEVVGAHIVAPPGKPTLVPETDKREAYHPHDAANDFAGVTE
nr:DUF2800 domain-containing protein [uncultured Caproiciproducens sp.]